MHSLISKSTEMCSLNENALLNLLNVPLNYLSKHCLPNCLLGIICSFYTFNAQSMQNQCVKMCSLEKSWGEPWYYKVLYFQ